LAQKMYDVAVKVGIGKDGKAIWKNVGVVLKGDKGPFMLLDRTFNPAGVPQDNNQSGGSLLINFFQPKEVSSEASGVPF
jgi:hypothetical protein